MAITFEKEIETVTFKVATTEEEYSCKLSINGELFGIYDEDYLKVIRAIAGSDSFGEVLSKFKDIWWENEITRYMQYEKVI